MSRTEASTAVTPTTPTPTPQPSPPPSVAAPSTAGVIVTLTTLLVGVFMVVVAIWALASPDGFADAVKFPPHTHFLHDIGAFQLGLGIALLLALIWPDSLAVALGGALVTNTVHAVNHAVDLDLGGRDSDPWLLGLLAVLTAVALVLRWRQLDGVLGRVETGPVAPALLPFVRQKTVVVTTFRRDGTAVTTPVSIAVDGDRAFFRSYEKAGKTRRLRRDPRIEVAPSTARGRPTGDPLTGRARRLDGQDDRHARRLLARKHPLLHGVVVPLSHRLGRRSSGRTVHFEVTPD